MGAGPLGSTSEAVKAFEVGMWVVNPFGMAAFKIGVGLYGTIGLYILGTMFSALVWGMIDALLFGGKGEGESL